MTGRVPRVSVVAVSYNHARYVAEALDSVAAQTLTGYELVVADDASTDDSADRIEAWLARHPGIPATFLRHRHNRGPCATLNEAVAASRGEYLSTIACDDAWLPEKLARQVAVLDADDGLGAVYGDAYLVGPDGEDLGGRFVASYADFATPPEGDLYPRLLRGNFIPGVATTIRRRSLDDVGMFDERLVFEDWDFWLRLARRYRFAYSPYVSARYRVLANSLVRTMGDRADEAYLRIYLANAAHAGADRGFVRGEITRLTALLAARHPERRRELAWQRLRHAPSAGALRDLARALR